MIYLSYLDLLDFYCFNVGFKIQSSHRSVTGVPFYRSWGNSIEQLNSLRFDGRKRKMTSKNHRRYHEFVFFGGFKDQQNHVLPSHVEDFDHLIIFDLFSINRVMVRGPMGFASCCLVCFKESDEASTEEETSSQQLIRLPTADPISLFFQAFALHDPAPAT